MRVLIINDIVYYFRVVVLSTGEIFLLEVLLHHRSKSRIHHLLSCFEPLMAESAVSDAHVEDLEDLSVLLKDHMGVLGQQFLPSYLLI